MEGKCRSRRPNHVSFHVRGYREEGTIPTPFEMTMLNDLDRFHLKMDTIGRVPQTGDNGSALKRRLKGKQIEHREYISQHGQENSGDPRPTLGFGAGSRQRTEMNLTLPMAYSVQVRLARHGDSARSLTTRCACRSNQGTA